ncbi:hypothetical protein EV674_12513 [Simplicispira metamorpha]|uniref:Uncharacterized protein n=1 Tax=Simplicispira metamorpha TaxID=80881 RepID=A0A4R2N448_9BURK|nr:hypothetical protein EV674_12513 [Simplicispira metamorpha]
MKRKHQRTLKLIFARPNVQWRDIEGLFEELGAQSVSEKAAVWRLCCLAKYVSFTDRIPRSIPIKVPSQALANGLSSTE